MRGFILGALALSILGSGVGYKPWASEHHHHHSASEAKDNITVVVNLTKDKGQGVEMAFNFLNVSLQRGNESILWLNADGVKLAAAGSKTSEKIKEVVSKGGKVYVCPICAKKAGITKLTGGAEFANPDIVFSLLSKDRVRLISW